ncbi:MAG: hypothetical protein OHK0029_20630 [Armatimonadaceae bacterium]
MPETSLEQLPESPPAAPPVAAMAAATATALETPLLRFDAEVTPGQTLLSPVRNGDRVQRPILLFRAGNYPDKGVSVTPVQLHQIVERFQHGRLQGQRIPVKVEHRDSPLDPLGEVVALYVQGEELFAMVEFSAGIHAHIEARGVRSFSAAFLRDRTDEGEGFTLKEASLVTHPRIADAGFLEEAGVEQRLSEFRRAGKVTPAMEPPLRRLLVAGAAVTFCEGVARSVDIASETAALLNALPVLLPHDPVSVGHFTKGRRSVSPEAQRIAVAMGVPVEKLSAC